MISPQRIAIIMGGGTPNGEPTVGSDGPRQKGLATVETLRSGCIAWVEKEGHPRRAEILSIKEMKSGKQFYCNFDNFNKRLDEWVPVSRILFDREVEWPSAEKDKPKDAKIKKVTKVPSKKAPSKKAQKRPGRREQSEISEAATPRTSTGMQAKASHNCEVQTNTTSQKSASSRAKQKPPLSALMAKLLCERASSLARLLVPGTTWTWTKRRKT